MISHEAPSSGIHFPNVLLSSLHPSGKVNRLTALTLTLALTLTFRGLEDAVDPVLPRRGQVIPRLPVFLPQVLE